MGKHQLYYSTKCRFCQAFLEELANTPFVSEFQLICADPGPSRPRLPTWLKSVPSLVVSGEDAPRVGPGAVNNWLFERKLGATNAPKTTHQAMEERNAPLAQPVYSPDIAPRPDSTSRIAEPGHQGRAPKAAADEGPMAYHSNEMGASKWSDNYSFVGDPFTSDKGYNPIGRNFESLLSGPAGSSAGLSAGPSAPKRTAKEDKLLREFEQFTASRDKDVPHAVARQ